MTAAGIARSTPLAALVVAMLVAPTSAQTPSPSPEPASTPGPSLTKTFVIDPEQSDQTFVCESGRVQSVLAFSIGEHRMVSVIYIDKTGAAIPAGVWSEAFGFRLLHRQTVKIESTLICGG